jgi:hypothetical protein
VTVELVAATDLNDEERRRLHQAWWRNPAALVFRIPVILVATLLALSLGIIPAALVLAIGIGLRALVRFAGSGWGRCGKQRQRGARWAGWGRGVDPATERSTPGGPGRARLIAFDDHGVAFGGGHWRGNLVTVGWPDVDRLRLVFSAGTTSAGVEVIERSGDRIAIILPIDDDVVEALRDLGATLQRVRPTAPEPADVARHVVVKLMPDPETAPHFGTSDMGWVDFTLAMSVMIGPAVVGGAIGGLVLNSWQAAALGVTLGLIVGGALTGSGFRLAERYKFEPGTWTSEGIVSGRLLPAGTSDELVKWVHVHSDGIDVRAKQQGPNELTIPWTDIAGVNVGSAATGPFARVTPFALRRGITFTLHDGGVGSLAAGVDKSFLDALQDLGASVPTDAAVR